MEKDYYLGLDMGSGSVGWAVTDDQYHILRAHGKALWGTRLFEAANTAEDRRINRTARRRLKRRNQRIEWLQEIFAEEINTKDSGFFRRMKESRYWAEDKQDENGNCLEMPYSLFIDKDFTDKEYHEKFPTIYHLRKYLMATEETPDIRLVYLAFQHMMKHRGHFLLNGSIEEIREFRTTFDQFLEVIRNEEMGFDGEITEETYNDIENTLKNVNLTRSAKKSTLVKLLKGTRVEEKELLALISGCTVKLSNIYNDKSLDETERPKISFADAGFDDYEIEIQNNLNERYCIIESAKAVYDWAALADILGKCSSISEAKVALYEKHHNDLQRRVHEATGGLFDQQLMKKGKGQVPVKGSDERLCDIEKYGGYNKEAGAYFVLVESDEKKGKKKRTIEYVPIRLKKQLENNREALENYLQEQRKLINPIVLLDKIKIDSLFRVDGFFMWLSGRTGNQLLFKCANQLILSTEDEATLKKVVKFVNRRKENKEIKIYESDKLNEEMLDKLYNTFLYKLQNSVYGNRLGEQAKTLSSKKVKFDELRIEEKCLVLYEILHMFQCQSVASDLKLIEGPGKAGILVLNSNITKCKNICMINQSPTGIYEQVIDLQKL